MAAKKYLLTAASDGQYAFEWNDMFTPDTLHGQHFPTIGIYNPSGATINLYGHYYGSYGGAGMILLDNGEITESKIINMISQVPWLHIDITGSAGDVYIWVFG
jgi:hypothetical protein